MLLEGMVGLFWVHFEKFTFFPFYQPQRFGNNGFGGESSQQGGYGSGGNYGGGSHGYYGGGGGGTDSSQESMPSCRCELPAVQRTVQKDGVNKVGKQSQSTSVQLFKLSLL